MKMSAVPKLSPSLGLSFTAHMPYRLSLTAELTYKQVGIDAPIQTGSWNAFLGSPRLYGVTLRVRY